MNTLTKLVVFTTITAALLDAVVCAAGYAFDYEATLPLSVGSVGKPRPVAISIDPTNGEICVTDVRQSIFHLLNPSDVEVFRTSRLADLSYPADGAIDRDGGFVFTDRGRDFHTEIRRLNVFGEPVAYAAQPPIADWNPDHLLITRDGDYLTLDSASGVLAKHDAHTGALLWQRDISEGRSFTAMGRPAEASDGRIYVPGGDLRHIIVLAADGALLDTFGRFGSSPGRMSFPVAVAFGPQGEVLVLDRMRACVLVFDSDHTFVTEFGKLGFRPGQLYHPLALAATPEGRIYVAQGFEGRVQVFRMRELGRR